MACGWEREWVVSGGVCFGSHPRGPVWADARGGGASLPRRRSMVRVAGLVSRWRTSIPSTLRCRPAPGTATGRGCRLRPYDVLDERYACDAA